MNSITHITMDDAHEFAQGLIARGWLNSDPDCVDTLYRQLVDITKIPDGYQLAPLVATPEMERAGQSTGVNATWSYAKCYRNMLDAQPGNMSLAAAASKPIGYMPKWAAAHMSDQGGVRGGWGVTTHIYREAMEGYVAVYLAPSASKEELPEFRKPPLPAADHLNDYGARLFLVGTLCNYGTECANAALEHAALDRGASQVSAAAPAGLIAASYKLIHRIDAVGKPVTFARDHPIISAIRCALVATERASEGQAQTSAAVDVLAERRRQVVQEGYALEHDDEHVNEEIAACAAFYAMPPSVRDWPASDTGYGPTFGQAIYPDWHAPKTGDRRRELVKAGALILAEVERIDRASRLTNKTMSHLSDQHIALRQALNACATRKD